MTKFKGWDDPTKEPISESGLSQKEIGVYTAASEKAAAKEACRLGIDRQRIELANGDECDFCGPKMVPPLRSIVYTVERAGKTHRRICAACRVNTPRQTPTLTVDQARVLERWFARWDDLDSLLRSNGLRHKKRRRVDIKDSDRLTRSTPTNIYWRGAASDPDRGPEWLLAEVDVYDRAKDAEDKRTLREYANLKRSERDRLDVERVIARLEEIREAMTYRRVRLVDGGPVFTDTPIFKTLSDALACRDLKQKLPLEIELSRLHAAGVSKKALKDATGYTSKRLSLAFQRGKACASDHTPDEQERPAVVLGGEVGPSPASPPSFTKSEPALNHSRRSKELLHDDRTTVNAA